jgi:hypothetical protein
MPQVETISRRHKRFFDYLQDIGRQENGKIVGKISFKDASDELEKMRRQNYNRAQYGLQAQDFLRWWAGHISKKRAEIGSSGGRPKKLLARRKNRQK